MAKNGYHFDEILELSGLEFLKIHFYSNFGENIFANLQKLVSLSFFECNLEKVNQKAFECLTSLQVLEIYLCNNFESLLAGIVSIRCLMLKECSLNRVNLDNDCLQNLESLSLRENRLTSMSRKFVEFKFLTTLDLSYNPLRLASSIFTGLANLENLYLNGVNTKEEIKQLPVNIFSKLKGL